MNMGSQVLPWTLVSLLSKDKASHEAGCAWLGAGGLQGNPSLSQPCASREQQEPVAIWAVWGMDQMLQPRNASPPSKSCSWGPFPPEALEV